MERGKKGKVVGVSGVARPKGMRRKWRGMYGGRGGHGSGGNRPGLLPTPARFFTLTRGGLMDRGRGKLGRHAEPIMEKSSSDMGATPFKLQVVLPNFIPNLNVLAKVGEEVELLKR